MLRTIGQVLGRSGGPVRACRRCGTTVARAETSCPACGGSEIATYDVGA